MRCFDKWASLALFPTYLPARHSHQSVHSRASDVQSPLVRFFAAIRLGLVPERALNAMQKALEFTFWLLSFPWKNEGVAVWNATGSVIWELLYASPLVPEAEKLVVK